MLVEGQKFGVDDRYKLVRLLGHGGFSEVWQAYDTMTHMQLAMKVYSSSTDLDASGIEMFTQEFSQVFELTHANLLKPTHLAKWNGHPYLIMPLCKNGSVFDKYLKGRLHITEKDCWHLLHDVAAGLAFLHGKTPPIVHQDIKPDNILIGDDGQYMITDFGISVRIRSTFRPGKEKTDGISGTIAYMPPEKFGDTAKPIMAGDIWSLGAMMYELMCGYPPFDSRYGGMLQKNGANVPKMDGDYSEELKQLVYQCLSLDPWERPKAEEIKERAEQMLESSITEHVIPPPSKPQPSPHTYPWKKLVIGCALILALSAVVVLGYQFFHTTGNEEATPVEAADALTENSKDIVPPILPAETSDTATPSPKPQEPPTPAPSLKISQPAPPSPSSKPTNRKLDYAEWTGSLKNGKPHGMGRMTFTVSHAIDGQRMAQAGDYLDNALFEDGELKYGTWCRQDGSIKEQIEN